MEHLIQKFCQIGRVNPFSNIVSIKYTGIIFTTSICSFLFFIFCCDSIHPKFLNNKTILKIRTSNLTHLTNIMITWNFRPLRTKSSYSILHLHLCLVPWRHFDNSRNRHYLIVTGKNRYITLTISYVFYPLVFVKKHRP